LNGKVETLTDIDFIPKLQSNKDGVSISDNIRKYKYGSDQIDRFIIKLMREE
jgi:hypothetical protein